MKQIRDNIFEVTFDDLGKPEKKGYYKVSGLGEVMLDMADVRYIQETLGKGSVPTFFVSRSQALKGACVVVSRRQIA